MIITRVHGQKNHRDQSKWYPDPPPMFITPDISMQEFHIDTAEGSTNSATDCATAPG